MKPHEILPHLQRMFPLSWPFIEAQRQRWLADPTGLIVVSYHEAIRATAAQEGLMPDNHAVALIDWVVNIVTDGTELNAYRAVVWLLYERAGVAT